MTDPMLPPALASKIGKFEPVRPLLRSEVRASAVIAVAIAAGAILLSLIGMRHDTSLTTMPFLAMLLARLCLAALLALLALRDAVPGQSVGVVIRGAIAAGILALFVLPLLFVKMMAIAPVEHIQPWRCFALISAVAAPSFLCLLWLLARAYPLNSIRSGLLAGLGAGIFAESAQFVACSNPALIHQDVVHGGAVITVALAGALGGALLGLHRQHQLSIDRM